MKLLNLDSSKTYSIPDLYLNIGHLLDHFMMLIFAKAAFDAGREFGLSYEEIIIYGTLGVVLFGAAAPLAGWLADKFSRAILITIYPFGLALGALLTAFSNSVEMLGISLGILGFFAAIYQNNQFCLITREATEKISAIHHREPLIINQSQINNYLNVKKDAMEILNSIKPPELKFHEISKNINNPINNDPALIKPLN